MRARTALLLTLGAVLGAAASAALTFRVAALTLAELRHLHRVVLELKRRLSVARVDETCASESDERSHLNLSEPGDPQGYGAQLEANYCGDGDIWRWLAEGCAHDGRPIVPQQPRAVPK